MQFYGYVGESAESFDLPRATFPAAVSRRTSTNDGRKPFLQTMNERLELAIAKRLFASVKGATMDARLRRARRRVCIEKR